VSDVAAKRLPRTWAAATATLVCVLALLGAGAPAHAQGLSVALPGMGVTLPSAGVTLPSVGVTVPSVGVTLPGVTVKTPEVSVSTPEVKVSTPEVAVTTPSSPGSGSEVPSGGGSSGSGSSGGGSSGEGTSGGGSSGGGSSGEGTSGGGSSGNGSSGAGSSGGGSSGGGSSTTSGVSPSASAASVSAFSAAPTTVSASASRGAERHSVAAAGKRSRPGAARAGNAPRGPRATAEPASNPLDAIGRHIPLPLPVPDWSKPIILVLLALAIGFAVRSRRVGLRALRLERQRTTLLRDVGAMQAALVPEIPARVGGLAASVAYRPADGPAAGGDFYDVFVPARGKVAIILGDVAGHGSAALTQAALTRYTLRAYLQAGLEPRAALALAGQVLADPGAEHFATVVLAVYDTREGLLTYASAGHPAPLVRGEGMRAPLELCASPPIGWTVPTGRRQTTVSLAPGAIVCLFSDGLIEARDDDSELLGRERLEELLAALGPRPDAGRLLASVRKAAPINPDDMAACILAPEVALIVPRMHVEELEVDARALAGGKVERFLEECAVADVDVELAIDRARDIASVWGSALMRVELEGDGATVAVAVPSSKPRVATPMQQPEPVGDATGAPLSSR
jgi:Stage II sporulation protein E (SpoIIE)